ncbi:ComEC/Rec2 family competence protein [Aquabacter sp. L1I39]|uniref:ComEC/Rec2 family competence protein n=1 Tax=Aquabacter sp. L1I39 TaxID=2820278 RepID=UPI001ADBA2A3|nr:ComEC/Rec2 family competence protein [Aquabacter sp. L1I39]QTL02636.1 ComEC/Rec2 family competence protein [Aquabacter sp. L1I39]
MDRGADERREPGRASARASAALGTRAPSPGVLPPGGGLVLPGTGLLERARARLLTDLWAEAGSGRLVLWLPVAFVCGILAYFGAEREPSLWAAGPAFLVLCGLAALARAHAVSFALLCAATAFSGGFLVATAQTARIAHPIILPPEGPVRFSGYVEARERRTTADGVVLYVTGAEGRGLAAVPQRVRLSLPRGSAPPEGSPVTQLARLLPPLGPAMPGAHDFGRKPWFEGIGAVGFGLGRPRPARLDTPPPASVKMAAAIAGVREALAARIRAVLSGPSADIAVALVTGERASIAPQVEESMRQSGLTHVLSISGLHMAMVAGTLFALVRGGLALFPPLALAFPVKSVAAGVALLGSAGYLALSGNDEPAQRSFIMAAVVLLGIVLGRAALNLRTVAVAGVLVLALSPVSVLDPGTQMSFAATLALVAAYERARPLFARSPAESLSARLLLKVLAFFGALAFTSLVAGLATAPFGAMHFQRLAPYGLLANLIAMPAVSALVMPFGLLGVLLLPFGWDSLAWPVMGAGIDIMLAISDHVAAFPGADMRTQAVGAGAAGLAALALATACLLRGSLTLLALLPALGALLVAGPPPRFDVLVSPDARTVAVRGADGTLSIAGAGSNRFLAEQWLAREGDPRKAADRTLAAAFRCTRTLCTAPLPGGETLALVRRAEGLPAACRTTQILVSAHHPSGPCAARIFSAAEMTATGALGLRRGPDGAWLSVPSRPARLDRPWMPRQPSGEGAAAETGTDAIARAREDAREGNR